MPKNPIGPRLRALRETQHLSQGDIEKRTGLLRCYISRVENQHTVPSLDTLSKLAGALGIELYQLFYEGDAPKAVESKLLPNKPQAILARLMLLPAEEQRMIEKLVQKLAMIGVSQSA